MVLITLIRRAKAKTIVKEVVQDGVVKRKYKGFIDSIQLCVRGGSGGMGYPKFGGLGGKGGDIVIECCEGAKLESLLTKFPRKLIKGGRGGDSYERCILGKTAADFIIPVPPGINVVDSKCNVIVDLDKVGETAVIARGGQGGGPDTGYCGMKGEENVIHLELKLLADIGLIGFPNAGKSTLLRAITRAKPKIASYPFTTLKPNIGVIEFSDKRAISLADLPGLIEGAHKNVGMGHRFLRHCERTKLLMLVVDINGFKLSHDHPSRSCLETVILLNKEMELYRSYLLDKPAILVINKMDVEGSWEKFKDIENALENMQQTIEYVPKELRPFRAIKFDEIIPISAKASPSDVENLKKKLRSHLDLLVETQLEDAEGILRQKLLLLQQEYKVKYV